MCPASTKQPVCPFGIKPVGRKQSFCPCSVPPKFVYSTPHQRNVYKFLSKLIGKTPFISCMFVWLWIFRSNGNVGRWIIMKSSIKPTLNEKNEVNYKFLSVLVGHIIDNIIGTPLILPEHYLGQRWVKQSTIRDSAESRWAPSGTALSQTQQKIINIFANWHIYVYEIRWDWTMKKVKFENLVTLYSILKRFFFPDTFLLGVH